MSVTRIAEAVQTAAWTRPAALASVRFQTEGYSVSQILKVSADVLGFMLNPVALTAFVLATWRIGQDLDWTGSFFIQQGLFSHWQVWLAVAMSLKLAEVSLRRAFAPQGQPTHIEQAPVVRNN